MKKILFAILFPITLSGQTTIETISKAKAYSDTYLSWTPQYYERASNGDTISYGFVWHSPASVLMDVVREDLNTGTATYKTLGVGSGANQLWAYCADSVGNIFIGFNGSRRIYRFNFNDSIFFKDLGVGFFDNAGLMYSASLGTDGNVYFGSSSTPTPSVSYWDRNLDSIITYGVVETNQDYILTVQGDSNYIYAQTGQRTVNNIWAIRKSDGAKQKLLSCANNTRFDTKMWQGKCYVAVSGVAWKLDGFDTTRLSQWYMWNALGRSVITGIKSISGNYNPATNLFQYKLPSGSNEMHINADKVLTNSVFMFFDTSHLNYFDSGFYYVGSYYGIFYHYSFDNDSVTSLGSTTINVDQCIQYNDSIFYFLGYADGTVLKWNKNQAWTMRTLVNGSVSQGGSPTDNPHVETHLKAAGGFQHVSDAVVDSFGNIVACGGVIRTFNDAGIATYNPTTHLTWGIQFYQGLGAGSLCKYKDHVLFSTNSKNGGHPKLYWYYSPTNTLDDSLDLNFWGYGTMEVVNDTLVSVGGGIIYKVYLPTKTLLYTYPITASYAFRFAHNIIGLNTTATLPSEPYFIKFNYNYGWPFNESVYTIKGWNILKITGLYPQQYQYLPAIAKTLSFEFYPNPATNFIYIKGKGIFILTDSRGNVLRARENAGVMPIKDLPAGVYFLNGHKIIKL